MAPADREETKEARSNPVLHIFIIHNCMPAREYHECSFTRRMLRTCCVTVLFGAYPLCSKFIFSARGNNNNNIGGLWAYLCFFVRVVSFCIFVVHVYSAVVVFLFLHFFSPGVRPSGGDGVTRVFFIVNAVSRFILGRE